MSGESIHILPIIRVRALIPCVYHFISLSMNKLNCWVPLSSNPILNLSWCRVNLSFNSKVSALRPSPLMKLDIYVLFVGTCHISNIPSVSNINVRLPNNQIVHTHRWWTDKEPLSKTVYIDILFKLINKSQGTSAKLILSSIYGLLTIAFITNSNWSTDWRMMWNLLWNGLILPGNY